MTEVAKPIPKEQKQFSRQLTKSLTFNTKTKANFLNHKILSLDFNQDGTKILAGHEMGFCVIDSSSMKVQVNRIFNKAVGCVQVADSSNIFALRGGGLDPICPATEVLIWDEKKAK
jgi:DNA mismatch repair ATPase MutS